MRSFRANRVRKSGRMGKILSHVLIVAWMVFIFYMSAQPGDTSGEISGTVSHMFMRVWNGVFHLGWSDATVLQMAAAWDYPIRKLAHMTEYGILAMLVYWALGYHVSWMEGLKEKLHPANRSVVRIRYMLALIWAVVYAATDELHQLFVPDRAGLVTDVLIDSCGALITLGVIFAVRSILQRKNRVIFRKEI